MNIEKRREIITLLRKSGSFLYHSIGTKSAQKRVLMYLDKYGEMSQRDLQTKMHVQSSSLSEVIKRLETTNLIIKERCKEDQRVVLLRLSDKGQKDAASKRDNMDYVTNCLLDCFDEEELNELYHLLHKMNEHWIDLKNNEKFKFLKEDD